MQEPIHSSPSSDSDFGALRQLIGEEATRQLIVGLGGVRIYIPFPDTLHADHKLVKCVGIDCARTICETFHKTDLDIPLGFEARYFKTRDEIKRLHAQGLDSRSIARHLGIHLLTVRRWLRRLGLPGNKPGHVTNFAKRDQIKALFDKGLDADAIAKELSINQKTIRKWFQTFSQTTTTPAIDHQEKAALTPETAPGRVPPTSA